MRYKENPESICIMMREDEARDLLKEIGELE